MLEEEFENMVYKLDAEKYIMMLQKYYERISSEAKHKLAMNVLIPRSRINFSQKLIIQFRLVVKLIHIEMSCTLVQD